jgi:hypothetical protein
MSVSGNDLIDRILMICQPLVVLVYFLTCGVWRAGESGMVSILGIVTRHTLILRCLLLSRVPCSHLCF